VKETLQTFSKNDKKLEGTAGFTAVLHTHSRRGDYHPHIHVVMPAGIINKETRSRRVKDGKYLFNHKASAKVFRTYLLKMMVDGKLQIPRKCPEKWVVDCKCVGNYLYKGVIQEKDILKCENGMVTFRYVHSKTKKYQIRCVTGEYFLWLLMQPCSS